MARKFKYFKSIEGTKTNISDLLKLFLARRFRIPFLGRPSFEITINTPSILKIYQRLDSFIWVDKKNYSVSHSIRRVPFFLFLDQSLTNFSLFVEVCNCFPSKTCRMKTVIVSMLDMQAHQQPKKPALKKDNGGAISNPSQSLIHLVLEILKMVTPSKLITNMSNLWLNS